MAASSPPGGSIPVEPCRVGVQHDTEGETAQPGGRVTDWRDGRAPPEPGRNAPAVTLVERDYTAVADRMAAFGPLAEECGVTVKGVTVTPGPEAGRVATRCGAATRGAALGRPLLDADNMCEAILAPSGTTTGRLAAEGFGHRADRVGSGSGLPELAASVAERPVVFSDTQERPVQVGASFEWSDKEAPDRRYSPFSIDTEHN
ncbi:hypothetical protein ACIODT_09970 [Streptomyces sp. NPDC088251]|uniref:hypothetical protein n=1 Tax=Streptomyces sp. NPDC088251 TaxID=3365844 RepID=UPI00382A9990